MNAEKSAHKPAAAMPGRRLAGALTAPGDKSVSHRALMLGALADGETKITGLLESADVLATLTAMQALGAEITKTGAGSYTVKGSARRLTTPSTPLDFGNAGTGVRLTMGLVAGAGLEATFIGDESLSARPMKRILDPLGQMGLEASSTEGRLPVSFKASALSGMEYAPPIASAQVKSAILLAGLGAQGETIVRESRATRDHTETMLKAFGADLSVEEDGSGGIIRLTGPQSLTACDVTVPGDPSSIAFALIAALVVPGSEVTITGVMMNPLRTGLIRVLKRMGADIHLTSKRASGGEEIADVEVRASRLSAIDLEPDIAPDMIDEYPILAVACAFANGTSRLRGLAELRAKESDRLAATHALLAGNGVETRIEGDDLIIEGGQPSGGRLVETHHDHRIAMSGLVLGLAARNTVRVDDISMIATSYPGFIADMTALGAVIETHT
ncbi:3-phosphoshikimate 1-carboxyvinyltransferase [Hyphobacterium sp.]|uniref:3-phosphoshikimate 1-carboxyvinyltransferase n=1 Tax=Hyphobacterium sp. TaxID=2004662 RepID=UPI003BAC174D